MFFIFSLTGRSRNEGKRFSTTHEETLHDRNLGAESILEREREWVKKKNIFLLVAKAWETGCLHLGKSMYKTKASVTWLPCVFCLWCRTKTTISQSSIQNVKGMEHTSVAEFQANLSLTCILKLLQETTSRNISSHASQRPFSVSTIRYRSVLLPDYNDDPGPSLQLPDHVIISRLWDSEKKEGKNTNSGDVSPSDTWLTVWKCEF